MTLDKLKELTERLLTMPPEAERWFIMSQLSDELRNHDKTTDRSYHDVVTIACLKLMENKGVTYTDMMQLHMLITQDAIHRLNSGTDVDALYDSLGNQLRLKSSESSSMTANYDPKGPIPEGYRSWANIDGGIKRPVYPDLVNEPVAFEKIDVSVPGLFPPFPPMTVGSTLHVLNVPDGVDSTGQHVPGKVIGVLSSLGGEVLPGSSQRPAPIRIHEEHESHEFRQLTSVDIGKLNRDFFKATETTPPWTAVVSNPSENSRQSMDEKYPLINRSFGHSTSSRKQMFGVNQHPPVKLENSRIYPPAHPYNRIMDHADAMPFIPFIPSEESERPCVSLEFLRKAEKQHDERYQKLIIRPLNIGNVPGEVKQSDYTFEPNPFLPGVLSVVDSKRRRHSLDHYLKRKGPDLGMLLKVKLQVVNKTFTQSKPTLYENDDGWSLRKTEWMQQETCNFDDNSTWSLYDNEEHVTTYDTLQEFVDYFSFSFMAVVDGKTVPVETRSRNAIDGALELKNANHDLTVFTFAMVSPDCYENGEGWSITAHSTTWAYGIRVIWKLRTPDGETVSEEELSIEEFIERYGVTLFGLEA